MGPEPKCVRISKRKAHEIESKAFEISSFKNKLETLVQ
jgi:hypothetical protein